MPQYIVIDALNPDPLGPSEVAFSLGPGPYGDPVQIDDSLSGGAQADSEAAANYGPFVYAGALYSTLLTASLGTIIRKSTDDGATWATEDDTFGQRYVSYFDGDHTLIAAYVTTGIVAGELRLRNYDLSLGTWGSVYGITTAPSGIGADVYTVWQRPDASILVFFRRRTSFPGDGTSGIDCAVWSGASWSEFDAGANILALSGWDASHTIVITVQNASYMDAAGRIGVFFYVTSSSGGGPPYWSTRCFYQQINLDNSLGSFFDFPGQSTIISGHQDLESFSGPMFNHPVLLPAQDTIVLPVLMRNRHEAFPQQVPCIYLGTPISAPVWTVDDSKYIDPAMPADDSMWAMEWGDCAFDGKTIWVVYAGLGSDYSTLGRVRLCQTSNLASPQDGWTAETVIDLATTAPAWFTAVSGQQMFVPSIFVPMLLKLLRNTFE